MSGGEITAFAAAGQAACTLRPIPMPAPTANARCALHEQRPAYARCMSCAKTLCQPCATQWEGIWYCSHCLAAKRGVQTKRSPAAAWIGVVLLSLTFLYLGARVMVWASALVAGFF